jgi:capsule polysaccharide export protein KpsE/RkpR
MSDSGLLPAMTRPSQTGLRLLRVRWKLVVLLGLLGAAAGGAYYAWMPKWYEAELLIVPKRNTSELAGARNLIGNLPLNLGDASPFGQSDAERIAVILESRSVTDAIIAKLDLIERYGTGKIERTRKLLWARCETTVEKKPDVVRLRCEDPEPAIARDLAQAIGAEADTVFRRIATASAREERTFLEKRVAEARRDLDASSDALRKFQETRKVIDLPEQGKAVVSGMATLEGDLISKRLELSYTRGFAAADEATVAQLRRQIGILSTELKALESRPPDDAGRGAQRPGSAMFPPAMELPALRAEMEALFREHKLREAVFVMLSDRYEARKLDEARDLATFVVVDDAALPTYRIRPTLRAVPAGGFLGGLLAILIVILPAWWRDLRRRAALEQPASAA